MMEPFQAACIQCSHVWSFTAGVATYAAIQNGAITYAVSASRYVLPAQFHLTLMLVITLVSMFLKIIRFRLVSSIKSAMAKVTTYSENESESASIQQVPQESDVPTRAMRKPRVLEQKLTSEFMNGDIDAAQVIKSEEVKID
jgi:hypothetical protein